MATSARSSTVQGDSEVDQHREKNEHSPPGQKQSTLGVDDRDLQAQNYDSGKPQRADGKIELAEEDAYDKLGYSLPEWRKWSILVLILLVQTSMNSNASMYGFAVEGISEEYGISQTKARLGQFLFLVTYAFGCELWAPWSEELGRWPTRKYSLNLVHRQT
jgi:hypothetical protein